MVEAPKNLQLRITTLYVVGLFTAVWISTFNAAFVNGDDVVHLSGWQVRDIFLPDLTETWIPNRVVDMYGRSLITASFDFLYFPAKAAMEMDFYLAYKIYSATLFGGFLALVYWYILAKSRFYSLHRPNRINDRGYISVVSLLLAILVITCFPWINQVHLVTYQAPAFISFALLNQLTRLLTFKARSGTSTANDNAEGLEGYGTSTLLLLAFIAAFSVESYTAIILASIVGAWAGLLIWLLIGDSRIRTAKITNLRRNFGLFYLGCLGAFIFCSLSLVIAGLFSGRIRISPVSNETLSLMALERLDLSVLSQSELAKLLSAHAPTFVALSIILVFISYATWAIHRSTAEQSNWKKFFRQDYRREGFLILCFSTSLIVATSFIVTATVSLVSGANYFSHVTYPWGDFLLIAKLAILFFIAVALFNIQGASFRLKNAIALLCFLVMSKYAFMFLNTAHDDYLKSSLVERAYVSAVSDRIPNVETGLSLEMIPMPIRPLPVKDDPYWFVESYRMLFHKYYELEDTPNFR